MRLGIGERGLVLITQVRAATDHEAVAGALNIFWQHAAHLLGKDIELGVRAVTELGADGSVHWVGTAVLQLGSLERDVSELVGIAEPREPS